jgi:hypothetical protein
MEIHVCRSRRHAQRRENRAACLIWVKMLVPSAASSIRHSEGACKTWIAATPALSALKGSACQRYHGNLERRSHRHVRNLPKDKEFLLACIGTFRDYHLLFDEQAAQIFNITDNIAERAGKIGGATIRT